MSQNNEEEFDFGKYGKVLENISGNGDKNDKPTPTPTAPPTPRKDYKKENTQLKAKIKSFENKTLELLDQIRELKSKPQESKVIIPTMIKVETLLTKHKEVSNTTKFLWKRINGASKPDRATVQKLLDFFRYCQEEGEL